MPFFIKRNQVQDVIHTKDGPTTIIRQKNWKRSELKDIIRDNPSTLFEVSESHADAVLRPQNQYQEVWDDVLAEINAELQAEAAASAPAPAVSKSRAKRIKSQTGEGDAG